MALRRQSLSPAAALLRNSRLFSLPNPLPRPQVGDPLGGGGIIKASDTATLPYPTHQAITTTPASLARGDWGLKRPLPNKSYLLKVSDPVLRISQVDTIEQVTDYDSAADHVRTREKWEEMGLPMMRGLSVLTSDSPTGADPDGAFEVRDDTTSYETDLGLDERGLSLKALKRNVSKTQSLSKRGRITPKMVKSAVQTLRKARSMKSIPEDSPLKEKLLKAEWTVENYKDQKAASFQPFVKPELNVEAHNTRRWKHDGPWLPGMSADEFVVYLNKEVSKRRPEFLRYLIHWVKSDIYKSRKQAASKQVNAKFDEKLLDPIEAARRRKEQERKWTTFTKQDIETAIAALRREAANKVLTSTLVEKLIVPFLKIPIVRFRHKIFAEDADRRDFDLHRVDDASAPLSTHPSAGLGYLRTKSYLYTHPILGPQAHPAPVPARVLQPRSTATGKEMYARFGVGGFVANDDLKSTDYNSAVRTYTSNAQDVETIDIDTEGGKKVLVQPAFGSVANNGRIMMKLYRATGQEGMVAQGLLDDTPVLNLGEGEQENLESGGENEHSAAMARELERILTRQPGARVDSQPQPQQQPQQQQ